jgi:hypothetical protein
MDLYRFFSDTGPPDTIYVSWQQYERTHHREWQSNIPRLAGGWVYEKVRYIPLEKPQ